MNLFNKLKNFILDLTTRRIILYSIATVPMTFSDYYTKSEIDERITNFISEENSPSFVLNSVTIDHDNQLVTIDGTGTGTIVCYQIHYTENEFAEFDYRSPYSSKFSAESCPTTLTNIPIANWITRGTYYIKIRPIGENGVKGKLSNKIEIEFKDFISINTIWGGGGDASDANSLSWPHYFVEDNNHMMWVTNKSANTVIRFNPNDFNGTATVFGSSGSGAGEFSTPLAMTKDGNGLIWVADNGNHRLIRFDPNDFAGTFTTFGSKGSGTGEFNSPNHIAIHPSTGEIYVNDVYNYRIIKFDQSNFAGTFTVVGGSYGTETGSFLSPIAYMEFDPSGYLWLARENEVLMKFDPGNYLPSLQIIPPIAKGDMLYRSYGISIDSGGYFWIAAYNNRQVMRFHYQNFQETLVSYFPMYENDVYGLSHVYKTSQGDIFISEGYKNRIFKATLTNYGVETFY